MVLNSKMTPLASKHVEVVTTKVVKVKERTVKQKYMGREISFQIFDICESMYTDGGITVNMYREVWVQDEENIFDPQLEEGADGEGDIEAAQSKE